jgi:small subunit ribosomal protein S34
MATPVAAAIKKLLPKELPSSLSTRSGNLYQVLSRYPNDGVGQRVHQTRWSMKGIPDTYWEVTRSRLKLEGKHGKAWGKLYWRGESSFGSPGLHVEHTNAATRVFRTAREP